LFQQPLACEPSWTIFRSPKSTGQYPFHVGNFVLRGDARGRISVWAVPEFTRDELNAITDNQTIQEHAPMETTTLDTEWDRLTRRLPGLIDRAVSLSFLILLQFTIGETGEIGSDRRNMCKTTLVDFRNS
jgi:hypothetical protein